MTAELNPEYIKHFGEQSADYLHYRPHYPESIFLYLHQLVKEHDLVWDCATGNGQAAFLLSKYFSKVVASDISSDQIKIARKEDNIRYVCSPADKIDLPDKSVDMITVAQALHFLNMDPFYTEAKRVLKPSGVIAAWCYSLCKISPDVDGVVKKLYLEILGDKYWPKERRYIDDHYQNIPFPFTKIKVPTFEMKKSATLPEMVGYLNTWSAVKEYIKVNGNNPIDLIAPKLKIAWGDESVQDLKWDLHLIAGRVDK